MVSMVMDSTPREGRVSIHTSLQNITCVMLIISGHELQCMKCKHKSKTLNLMFLYDAYKLLQLSGFRYVRYIHSRSSPYVYTHKEGLKN